MTNSILIHLSFSHAYSSVSLNNKSALTFPFFDSNAVVGTFQNPTVGSYRSVKPTSIVSNFSFCSVKYICKIFTIPRVQAIKLISLNTTDQLVFIMEKHCVLFAVWTEFFNHT
jgi:hypothetical protein